MQQMTVRNANGLFDDLFCASRKLFALLASLISYSAGSLAC